MATMKSVPRMPIVAVGTTSENAPGLRFPNAPVTARSAPRKRTNAARSAFGSCGRKRESSIRNCVFSWSATTWPSSKRRTTREPGAVVTTVPESTRWFAATGLLWAGVAPARTSPFNSCTTAAPRALAAEKRPAIPNARIADERYRSLIGLTFPPFPARPAGRCRYYCESLCEPGEMCPAIMTPLRVPGFRRDVRDAVLRARRLGYCLSEVAAEIALHFASRVGGPEAEGRGFLPPWRRRRGQRDGQLDLAGCVGRRVGRHDVHRHLEIALLRPGRAGKREGKNRTDRILRESLHDLPPSSKPPFAPIPRTRRATCPTCPRYRLQTSAGTSCWSRRATGAPPVRPSPFRAQPAEAAAGFRPRANPSASSARGGRRSRRARRSRAAPGSRSPPAAASRC